jgi:putative heme transporter
MQNTTHHNETSPGYMPPRVQGRIIRIAPSTIWLIFGIIVATAIITYILARATDIFVILFIAIIFAETIRPIINWLHRHHIPRPAAVLLIYLGIVVVLAFLGWLLVTPIIAQIGSFQQSLPQYMRAAQRFFARVQAMLGHNPQVAGALNRLTGQLGGILSGLLQYVLLIPLGIGIILGGTVAMAAMAFFWLSGVDQLRPFVIGLFPEQAQARAGAVFAEMGRRLGGYARGVVLNMFIIGILSGLGNFLLNVPYAVLLGILAGLTEVLPYVGPWISGFAAVMVTLITAGIVKAGLVAGLYILIQTIEGNTLVPIVMNRTVHLNPLIVIVAVLTGGVLYGIVGGILAVPVAAVIEVLVVDVLAPAARNAASHVSHPTAGPDEAADRQPPPEWQPRSFEDGLPTPTA